MAGSYRAAVAEHKTVGRVDENHDAMAVVKMNMELYRATAKAAREDGAQIVIFPEWGLFGTSGRLGTSLPASSRAKILPFSQPIGKPGDDLTALDASFSSSIVSQLASIAKDIGIVVVANVCERTDEDKIYNTEVAISEEGVLLAKYHKMHPFLTWTFDTPDKEVVTFETSFGVTFGLFVCRDLLHSEPQKSLIEEQGVTQIPYSVAIHSNPLTRWYGSRWSKKNKATLLAANLGGGSEIFAGGDGGAVVVKREKFTAATINL